MLWSSLEHLNEALQMSTNNIFFLKKYEKYYVDTSYLELWEA